MAANGHENKLKEMRDAVHNNKETIESVHKDLSTFLIEAANDSISANGLLLSIGVHKARPKRACSTYNTPSCLKVFKIAPLRLRTQTRTNLHLMSEVRVCE